MAHPVDVAGDHAGIRLTDLRKRLSTGMIDDLNLVHAFVWFAVSKDGDVNHKWTVPILSVAPGFIIIQDFPNYNSESASRSIGCREVPRCSVSKEL